MAKTILIVDDDPTQRRLLQAAVERQGFNARTVGSGDEALEQAGEPRAGVDLVLLDLVMPGLSGLETLQHLQERRPDLPVIVLTATGGIDTVVSAMRAGAVDFFVKPVSPERVVVSIRNALKLSDLSGEVKRLKKSQSGGLSFDDLIATAPTMRHVVRLGQRGAASNIPMLLLGESGVGKEVIARAIQAASERRGKPFVAVNCGAIPENLVESILFGHEKGSFTGAHDKHLGKFAEANGGTLFLDEVGELPLDIQVKLLRVLQEGEVDPVGSRRPVKVDVRIISATNKDLQRLVSEGRFREDLYYRLNVFPIEVPPLRERKEDIPALIEHFIRRFNAEEGKHLLGASAETMALLTAFDWPGNVRQLENSVFRAVVLSDGRMLSPEDFPQLSGLRPKLLDAQPKGHADTSALIMPVATATLLSQPIASDLLRVALAPFGDCSTAGEELAKPVEILDAGGHLRPLEAIERDLIQYAIDVYSGHMSEVARRLGIGRSTLYRKVREHDIKVREAEI
jgi:DNA-binding NtrC family response regulator